MLRAVHGCTNAVGAGSAEAAFFAQFCLALHPFIEILNRFLALITLDWNRRADAVYEFIL